MSVTRRAWTGYQRLCLAVLLPAVLAHELAHAIAAGLLGAESVEVNLSAAQPHVLMDFGDLPRWRVRVACLAPTIVGLVWAGSGIALFGPPPLSPPTVLVAGYWALFTVPSRDDIVARAPE